MGPNLDEVLPGKDAAFIEKAIVDPNAEITPGFQPNVMPQTFGQDLSPEDLKGLVDYILQSVGSGSGGGGRRRLAPTRTAPARRSRPPDRRPRA